MDTCHSGAASPRANNTRLPPCPRGLPQPVRLKKHMVRDFQCLSLGCVSRTTPPAAQDCMAPSAPADTCGARWASVPLPPLPPTRPGWGAFTWQGPTRCLAAEGVLLQASNLNPIQGSLCPAQRCCPGGSHGEAPSSMLPGGRRRAPGAPDPRLHRPRRGGLRVCAPHAAVPGPRCRGLSVDS